MSDLSPLLVPRNVVNCPACGVAGATPAFAAGEEARERFRTLSRVRYGGRMAGWDEVLSLSVHRCDGCGHLWHADQPDPASLKAMYDARAALRRNGARKARPEREQTALLQMQRLRRLFVASEAPTLLDYGAGSGVWARAALSAGFDVIAFEPSSSRFTAASDCPRGRNVRYVADLDELSKMTFDAINFEQVLEHLPDPFTAICDVKKFMTAKTILRISVPNVGVAARRPNFWSEFPFSGKAHLLSPYEHLHGFNGNSLRHLADRSGIKEIPLVSIAGIFPAYAAYRLVSNAVPSRSPTFFVGSPKSLAYERV